MILIFSFFLLSLLPGVCGSVDVRNSPTHLERLKDCVVVEGFVHILLIDKYGDASFENYSFPLLTEITEYLLLFRVNGLKTLRRLFPNLAVIRGDVLVGDYAMVIYELMHIEVSRIELRISRIAAAGDRRDYRRRFSPGWLSANLIFALIYWPGDKLPQENTFRDALARPRRI